MLWMMFLYYVLTVVQITGEGMTGSDLKDVQDIWHNSQPTQQSAPVKKSNKGIKRSGLAS